MSISVEATSKGGDGTTRVGADPGCTADGTSGCSLVGGEGHLDARDLGELGLVDDGELVDATEDSMQAFASVSEGVEDEWVDESVRGLHVLVGLAGFRAA